MSSFGPDLTQDGTDPNQGREDRSIGEILSDVTTDLSTLMRQELELAKAELKQTATRAGAGAGMFGGAAIAGHMVLVFLSLAAWWALGTLIGLGWSALVVAVIWAVIAAVLALTGKSQLARARGIPRTTETVSKIPDALKGNEPSNSGIDGRQRNQPNPSMSSEQESYR